jgi:ribonuclease T2
MQATKGLVLAGLAWLGMSVGAWAGGDIGPRTPGRFDYFVLALTWVPGFCAGHRSGVECTSGQGFALHGLWPQLEGGDYPTACPGPGLAPAERDRFAGLYPSPAMIDHEWPKHGTCSGLSPAGYFALALADEGRVAIPPPLRTPRTLMATDVRAVRHVVTGVEICFTRRGAFRACS